MAIGPVRTQVLGGPASRGFVVVIALSVAALGSCGTKSTSSPTTTPATTAPQKSTVPAVTTAAAATTAPTTAAPTTRASLVLPTVPTTVDPAAQEQAIRAGWKAAWDAYKETLAGLPSFDPAGLKTAWAEPQLGRTIAAVQVLVDKGWRTRPGPKPDYRVIEKIEIVDDTHAILSECTFSTAVVFDPNLGPDGTPQTEVIVNDKAEVTRTDRTMLLESGAWKSADTNNAVRQVGENTCLGA
jgi:hypothetical protein